MHLFVSRTAATGSPSRGSRNPPGAAARRHPDFCRFAADRRRAGLRCDARVLSDRLSRAVLRELSAGGSRRVVEPRLRAEGAHSGVFFESAELPPRARNFLTKI